MTPLMMYVGIACIFVGGFVLIAAIGGLTKETDGVGRSVTVLEALTNAPAQMRAEVEPAFGDRVLTPLLAKVQGISSRLTPSDSANRLREKMDRAGNPGRLTVERINGLKVIGFVVGLLVSLVISVAMGFNLLLTLIFVVGFSVVGYMGPNLYLSHHASERSEQMRKALPDAIDLLTISVESGLGFDAALSQVARNTEGPLADEFARMLQEMQIGLGRADALRSFGDRTTTPEIRQFVGAMVQADAFGIPIGTVLRVQSSEIRVKRRQWAEEAAQKVPVKILIPLIFCILPRLFIGGLGPAGISIMKSFSGKLG